MNMYTYMFYMNKCTYVCCILIDSTHQQTILLYEATPTSTKAELPKKGRHHLQGFGDDAGIPRCGLIEAGFRAVTLGT